MLYLIKSYLHLGKHIYKIGFTDNIEKRRSHYFYSAPGNELLTTREGDELLEKLIHYYLYYRGFKYTKFGKLEECGDTEVLDIFHYSKERLEKELWKHRGEVFNPEKISDRKLFEYLYQKNKDKFIGEKFMIGENKKVIINSRKTDVLFWKKYSSKNKITPPLDINIDPGLRREIDDFLDNHFYKTGIFDQKLKMYCEFMDKHKGNQEVSDILYYKIKDDRFRKYYNFFGTSGCRASSYAESRLYSRMMNVSKESELSTVIYSKFKVNSKYTLKEIKSTLQDIYRDLGIKVKKPKAIDLGKYFNLQRARINQQESYYLKSIKL